MSVNGDFQNLATKVTPEEIAVLRTRARELARVESVVDTSQTLEVVEFILAGEHYALETCWVREVYPLKELTPLPCVPSWVRGIVNVRSQILAVVDLRRFFDLPNPGLSDLSKILILQDGETQFGIFADAISGVRQLPLAAIQTHLLENGNFNRSYLRGVTAEHLIVLDGGQILRDERLLVQEEVTP